MSNESVGPNRRLPEVLAHDMRDLLHTAFLSFEAIRSGNASVDGATSAALGRSLTGLRDLIDRSPGQHP
jgi:hypothetical protein